MWRVIVVFIVAACGFWYGMGPNRKSLPLAKLYPPIEEKSFVFILYGHNQSLWCERTLRSVFEQDYNRYRVIFIDDNSIDGTLSKATQFVEINHQQEKTIFIRNEVQIGEFASTCRAIDSCLDSEVIVPLSSGSWLSSPYVLDQLNSAYQNSDVWVLLANTMTYPSYETKEAGQISYYAKLFKQIRDTDGGDAPILDKSRGHVRKLEQIISFCNDP